MELAGAMWKQNIKPPPVTHSRCSEQHQGLSKVAVALLCTAEILLFSTNLLPLCFGSLSVSLLASHCKDSWAHSRLTETRPEHLMTRCSIFLPAIHDGVNEHKCQTEPCSWWHPYPGNPMPRKMLPILWSSWSVMNGLTLSEPLSNAAPIYLVHAADKLPILTSSTFALYLNSATHFYVL